MQGVDAGASSWLGLSEGQKPHFAEFSEFPGLFSLRLLLKTKIWGHFYGNRTGPGSRLQLKSEPARRGRGSLVSLVFLVSLVSLGLVAGLGWLSPACLMSPLCCHQQLPGTRRANPGVPLGKDLISARIYPTLQGLKPFLAGTTVTLH